MMNEREQEFTGDIEHDLNGLNKFEPIPEEQAEHEKIWAEIVEQVRKEEKRILESNEKIYEEILKLNGEKYLNAVKKCLDALYEDCYLFGLPPELSLVKKPRLNSQEEDWGEFDHVIVDQYLNGGMEGDSFAGYLYIPLKENLYLKTHYNM